MGNQLALINFLVKWHMGMLFLAYVLITLGIVIYLFYHFRLFTISNFKKKYDYINAYEFVYYKRAVISFSIGIVLFLNTLWAHWVASGLTFFFARFVLSLIVGVLFAYVAWLALRHFHLPFIQKKLEKWRFAPRVNPLTGNQMILEKDTEADVFLIEGLREQEGVYSIDFDVWADEATGELQIEKYPSNITAKSCDHCHGRTLKVDKEEVIREATTFNKGELLRHHECTRCHAKKTTLHHIRKSPEATTVFQPSFHHHYPADGKVPQVW